MNVAASFRCLRSNWVAPLDPNIGRRNFTVVKRTFPAITSPTQSKLLSDISRAAVRRRASFVAQATRIKIKAWKKSRAPLPFAACQRSQLMLT